MNTISDIITSVGRRCVAAFFALFAWFPELLRQWLTRPNDPALSPRRAVPLWVSPRLASVLCILFLLICSRAQAQVTPTTVIQLTNLPASYQGTVQTNLFQADTNSLGIPTNNVINLRQGTGMALWSTVSNLVSSGGSVVINWAVSADGTNWSFPPYGGFSVTNTAAGTTPPIVNSVNEQSALLNNFTYASPYSITNTALVGTNTALTSSFVGFGNVVPAGYP